MADNAPGTLLIPALLDHHWPLLRWAFETSRWHAEVLEDRRGVEDLGLRHVHGDLCYPFVLITGQVLAALRSGRYDPARTAVLISQAGDACRGSCLIRLLRPVLDREGFAQVRLLSLNVRGIEEQAALPVTVPMARRAMAGEIRRAVICSRSRTLRLSRATWPKPSRSSTGRSSRIRQEPRHSSPA